MCTATTFYFDLLEVTKVVQHILCRGYTDGMQNLAKKLLNEKAEDGKELFTSQPVYDSSPPLF